MRRRSAWSSCVPWLKFRRNTSAPASTSARMRSRVELAGPNVARMRARLLFIVCGLRCRAAGSGDHDGTKIVDVGQSGPRNERIAQSPEQTVAVVVIEILARRERKSGVEGKRVS